MDTEDIISHFKMMVVFHIMDRIIAGITDFVQDNCPQCQALDLEYYHECSLDTWFHIHNLRELFPYFYTQCRKTLIGQDEQFEFVIKVQRAIKDRVKREDSELNVPLLMSLVNTVALQDLVTSRQVRDEIFKNILETTPDRIRYQIDDGYSTEEESWDWRRHEQRPLKTKQHVYFFIIIKSYVHC